MIYECIYCIGDKIVDILPVIISIFAVCIAFYSWLTNSEPVIVFIWDNDKHCYYIKNVGKGPAMNIIVTYINDTESPDWKNPVKCYSLEPNGTIDIDWGLKSGGILFSRRHDQGMPSDYVNGVTKLAAIYSSANFLIKQTYTSVFEDETIHIRKGNKIRQWTGKELFRIWDLKRKSEEKK